jgi:exosome complex component RRP4
LPIYFKDWDLVVPGELLAEGDYRAGPGVLKEGNKLYSTTVGIFKLAKGMVNVIALNGPYIPEVGDLVIGEVVDILPPNYVVDIRAPHTALLHVSEASLKPVSFREEDLRSLYDVGDMLLAKVSSFERAFSPSLTCKERGLGKITKGLILAIPPARVPRLIGKRSSMISMIRSETGCKIVVGQNGYVWVVGRSSEDEKLVAEAVRKVVEEAHVAGLTARVMSMLKARKKAGQGASTQP